MHAHLLRQIRLDLPAAEERLQAEDYLAESGHFSFSHKSWPRISRRGASATEGSRTGFEPWISRIGTDDWSWPLGAVPWNLEPGI
jgi:hypothetical protein